MQNKTTRIILHIGTKKTGSKAIESFLIENREQLKKKDILYYEPLYTYFNHSNENNIKPNAVFLNFVSGYMSSDHDPNSIELFKKETEHFFNTIKDYSTVILSYEVMWWQTNNPTYLNKLKQYFEDNKKSDIQLYFLVFFLE